MTDPLQPLVQVVARVIGGDAAEPAIRRLHARLRDMGRPCALTLVVDAADADGARSARRIAQGLPGVAARVEAKLDRKAVRQAWSASPAAMVAFVDVTPDADVDALLAPLALHAPVDPTGHRHLGGDLSRRRALGAMGALGIGAVLAACGSGSSSSAPSTAPSSTSTSTPTSTSTTTGAASSTTAATATATLLPEMTEGPYYLDLNLVRSDITEDREGAPLALRLLVVEAASGAPIRGAAVDIWHTDGDGLYSGFVSQSAGANGGASQADDGTFLRGTQLSDADGAVTFSTIYPGWYQGRTVHIHVKVHVDGAAIHTGQLFFDDAFTDAVFAASAPYSSRGPRDVRNSNDGIYADGGNLSVLAVTGTGGAYAATLAMGVQT